MYRFKDSKTVTFILSKGSIYNHNYFTLFYYPIKIYCKIGVIVPKRIGKAFLRNKVKRLFREAFINYSRTVGKEGYFIFKIQDRQCTQLTYWEIFRVVKQAIDEIG